MFCRADRDLKTNALMNMAGEPVGLGSGVAHLEGFC